MKYIFIISLLVFTLSCASNQKLQYAPEKIIKKYNLHRDVNENEYSVLGRKEEYSISIYRGIKAYRFRLPNSGGTFRIEKYKDNSCLLVAKGTGGGWYQNLDSRDVVVSPVVELKVEIKQECDRFIPLEKLDALFYGEEQFIMNNGNDYKEGMHYDDGAVVERVLEDGTFYYLVTRDKEEIGKITNLIREIWKKYVSVDILSMWL